MSGRGGCAGGGVRGDRLRGVRAQAAVPEPEGGRGERIRNYFRVNSLFFDPNIYGRFLAIVMVVLTTVVLWSRRPARGADRRGGARVAAGGARDELLAVEHRGAAARPGGARRLPLGRARDRVRGRRAGRDRGRGRARGAPEPALRPQGRGRLDQQRDERTHETDLGRPRTVRRSTAVRVRRGLVRNRVQAPRTHARRAGTRPRPRTRSRSRSPPSRASSAWPCTSRC